MVELWLENSGDTSKLPSLRYPSIMENGAIEIFVRRVTEDRQNISKGVTHPNLTRNEFLELKQLRANSEIMIKPSDKGSNIALKFVLHHNVFLFDGLYYLQRQRVAMGAKCVPSYANLYLGEWECRLFSADEYEMYLCHILRWYIDGIMLIWQGSEKLLKEFDNLRLEFLDIEIKKDSQGMCIEGIPIGQYLRLRRICSSEKDFNKKVYKLYQGFKARGYKTRSLHKAYQWVSAQNSDTLFYRSNRSKIPNQRAKGQNQTRFIMTYSNNDKDIRSIIYKHWDILSKDLTLGRLVTSHPRFTFKKNTRIGDMLTQSHFQKHSKTACCKTPAIFRCEQCRFIKLSNTFWFNTYKSELGLNGHLNFQAFVNK
ncbi:hypothetical protein XELAEV_18027009mg [Xenopus laevis]|uniref:Uncharacterized protein n=1 Tax=Xenopus laevis TaxID=8355 RepID=A0A974CUS8_XENLA|nr:hypothetical protein XELAEV_18027009mg [Xenopus laevis]